MVLLDYKCTKCGKVFEELVKSCEEKPQCPVCGGETVRNYSGKIFTGTGETKSHCTGNCKTCSGCGK